MMVGKQVWDDVCSAAGVQGNMIKMRPGITGAGITIMWKQVWDGDAEEAEEAWAAAQIRSGAGAAPVEPQAQRSPQAPSRASPSGHAPSNRGAVQVVAAGDEVMRSLQQGMEQLQVGLLSPHAGFGHIQFQGEGWLLFAPLACHIG